MVVVLAGPRTRSMGHGSAVSPEQTAPVPTSILKGCPGEKSSPETGLEMSGRGLSLVSGLGPTCLRDCRPHPASLNAFSRTVRVH